MTDQNASSQTREAPTVTLVVSNPLFPEPVLDQAGKPIPGQHRESVEPITWILNRPHPFVNAMKIVGMFINRRGIKIYSTDGKIGMRDLIPLNSVRLAQEGMPLDVFEEEFALAEDGYDDDDDLLGEPSQDDPESEPGPETEALPANGQA